VVKGTKEYSYNSSKFMTMVRETILERQNIARNENHQIQVSNLKRRSQRNVANRFKLPKKRAPAIEAVGNEDPQEVTNPLLGMTTMAHQTPQPESVVLGNIQRQPPQSIVQFKRSKCASGQGKRRESISYRERK